MRRKNLLLTFAIGAAAGGVALIFWLIPDLQAFFLRILKWIFGLLRTSAGNQMPAGSPPAAAPPGDLEMVSSEPAWMKTAVTAVVLGGASAAVLFGLYFLIRKLKAFFKLLGSGLQKYMQAVSEDYVDVITDTRDGKKKWKKLSAVSMRKLTPAGRIRYRYGQLMRKHPEWAKGSTARENLPEAAAVVYERVRYSSYPAGEADARKFAEETKKV